MFSINNTNNKIGKIGKILSGEVKTRITVDYCGGKVLVSVRPTGLYQLAHQRNNVIIQISIKLHFYILLFTLEQLMWFNKICLETGEHPTEHIHCKCNRKYFLVLTNNLPSLFCIWRSSLSITTTTQMIPGPAASLLSLLPSHLFHIILNLFSLYLNITIYINSPNTINSKILLLFHVTKQYWRNSKSQYS